MVKSILDEIEDVEIFVPTVDLESMITIPQSHQHQSE
jgi:hypothetical protein